jgi:hypothetical protein
VISTGSILGKDGAASASDIGGFVGNNSGSVTNSFELPGVGQYVGTTDAHYVGGFGRHRRRLCLGQRFGFPERGRTRRRK